MVGLCVPPSPQLLEHRTLHQQHINLSIMSFPVLRHVISKKVVNLCGFQIELRRLIAATVIGLLLRTCKCGFTTSLEGKAATVSTISFKLLSSFRASATV